MRIGIGGDSSFFMELYSRYIRDRNSVPSDWAVYFEALDEEERDSSVASIGAQAVADMVLDAFRRYGHLEARLNPLRPNTRPEPALERLRGMACRNPEAEVELLLAGTRHRMRLGKVADALQPIYCGHAGLEVEHLESAKDREWWYREFERSFSAAADISMIRHSVESLVMTDEFEAFMRVKFPSKKRFGSEGAETSIVFLREFLRAASEQETDHVVMGGMHRGRLATLAVALGKNPAILAAELMGRDLSEGAAYTGDVPYHLGLASQIGFDERTLNLTLLPHPSHLMVVAPVTLGLARAMSRSKQDAAGSTRCLLLHTDAAFSGQGVTAELLQLGGLKGYSAAGSVHLIVNNQIGFTTLPSEGRSSRYCTDIGKAVGVPVVHVNGDDPIAVASAARLAMSWQSHSGRDILIDLICYRRHGHNELDEPRFTQPEIWTDVDKHATARNRFLDAAAADAPELIDYANKVADAWRKRLRTGFESAGEIVPNDEPVQGEAWTAITVAEEAEILQPVHTGVATDRLRTIGLAACAITGNFDAHTKVRQFYEARTTSIQTGEGINFATAEALAFATLMAEGSSVRISGQDTVRGTFTQRHLAIHDQSSGSICVPLTEAARGPNTFEAINSPLSEYAVLAFEYGHSLLDPKQLTIWEAQFGDFINGAQVVVDQYIVSAEAKWRLRSGLTVLLPHGLEGQGPDHSSARVERITQLCASGNIILAHPTTPANLFHLLRRQIVAPWRKPLFVIAPKSLLRSKAAVSSLSEMGEGTSFKPIIVGACPSPEKVRRVILCSGKIFYALEKARIGSPHEEQITAIRVEQIYPFPHLVLKEALAKFPGAECVWLQEEPQNQGAWPFVQGELARYGIRLLDGSPVISRPALPVSAAGSIQRHEREQQEILSRALRLAANCNVS